MVGGIVAEAAVLGLVGGLLGVLGGMVAAGPLVAGVSSFVEKFSGIHVSVHVTPSVVVAGAALGVIVSVLASLVPARRAARVDVVAELHGHARRSETLPKRASAQGAVLTAAGALGVLMTWLGQRDGALATWQPLVALVGLVIGTVCLFRAVGQWAPGLIRVCGRLPVFQRGPARVAVANLLREPKRTSVVATAVGAAVGLACVLGSLLPAISSGSHQFTERAAGGRLWVSSVPSNNGSWIDAKLSPADQAALAHLPGVAGVEGAAFLAINTNAGHIAVNGVDGRTPRYTLYRGGTGEAALARGEVMIGTALARSRHLRPGSTLLLPGRDGMVALAVGGVWGDPNGLGNGVTMSRTAMERIWGPQPVDELWLDPQPGVSPEALATTVRAAHLDPAVRALPPPELADDIAADIKNFTSPFWALQRALLLVAIIATVSTMLLVGLQRRREQGLLAALGMGPGDLGAMTMIEAGLIGLAGSVLGAVASVGAYLALAWVSPILTGLQPPMRFDPIAPLGYGLLATACVVLGAAWPAWRTSRLEVVTALQYE